MRFVFNLICVLASSARRTLRELICYACTHARVTSGCARESTPQCTRKLLVKLLTPARVGHSAAGARAIPGHFCAERRGADWQRRPKLCTVSLAFPHFPRRALTLFGDGRAAYAS
eukprot:4955134-Pleurochrysis_carterae.AAC.1